MAIPELELARATRALRDYCNKVPPEIRDQLTHDFRVVGSDIELFERRPHFREPGRSTELVVAKFRYTAARTSWTLLWGNRNDRWRG